MEQLSANARVPKATEVEPPGYGSVCSANSDCQHNTAQLECIHGTCVCLEGYVPLGKYLCYNVGGHGKSFVCSCDRSMVRNDFQVHRSRRIRLPALLQQIQSSFQQQTHRITTNF